MRIVSLARHYFLPLMLFSIIFSNSIPAANAELLVGWWANVANKSQFSTWAAYGSNFVHCNWCYPGYRNGAYTLADINSFMNEANANGMKVDMTANADDPGINSQHTAWPATVIEFSAWINNFKNHPALWGWYLSDEPELATNPILGHDYLAISPGYYLLTKSIDPAHYAWVVNSGYVSTSHDDVRDLHAIDMYPKSSASSEFGDSYLRQSYAFWLNGFNRAKAANKLPFVIVVQGMGRGYQGYGDMTLNELRYHVFSGIVQGIDKVLFWCYELTNPTMINRVNQTIGQIMAVKREIENGITNDPKIKINQSTASLTYRYGSNGNSSVILAVNIANSESASGSTLSDVQFTLPANARPSQVEVLSEGRTLPVTNGVFFDNFAPFAVHVYRFNAAASPVNSPNNLRIVSVR